MIKMFIPSVAVALFAVLSNAAVLHINPRACAADNCLRAIRASAFPTRPGTADCFSYFQKTVTPDVVTVTVTNTASTTASATESIVKTNTIHEIITQTVNDIATVASSYTETVTTTVYTDPNPVLGRRATVDPIPAYASPCSGISRYSSACSCIGATPTTLTLPASTKTVTVDATATIATRTETVVYATVVTTVIDGTETVTTTTATRTTPTLVATATETVSIRLSDAFSLQIQNGANAGRYLTPASSLYGFVEVGDSPYRWGLDNDNYTVAFETGAKLRIWGSGTRGSYASLYKDTDREAAFDPPTVSTIYSNGEHHPTSRGWTVWWSCKNHNELHFDVMNIESPSVGGLGQGNPCEAVIVKAKRWVF